MPKYNRSYSLLLWFFVAHTFAVAAGLFFVPQDLLDFFGLFGYQGRFFQTQAATFHVIMGIAYLLAIFQGEKNHWFIYFAVFAKSTAAVFLLLYYFLDEQAWIILCSAIGDGLMGLLLFVLFSRHRE